MGWPYPSSFSAVVSYSNFNGFRPSGASNKGGVGKTSHFLALNVNTLKTVGDTSIVTISD